MFAPITPDELATRLDALRVEIDTLADSAHALSFDTDREIASAAGGVHRSLCGLQKNFDLRGHAGLKSRLRDPE